MYVMCGNTWIYENMVLFLGMLACFCCTVCACVNGLSKNEEGEGGN